MTLRKTVRRAMLIARYAWALPATSVGLALSIAAVALGARCRIVDGVLETGGGRIEKSISMLPPACRFGAITFGHVIIGVDHGTLARLRRHERVHVRQYERWGVLLIPLYLGSSLLQYVRGRDPYMDNRFEREAFAREKLPDFAA